MSYEDLKTTVKVDSKNQMKTLGNVRFEEIENKGTRVLFVGNSITLHAPAENIGWHGDWGMAASAKEKDYVHLVERHIKTIDNEAAFCICNAADWEREYKKCSEILGKFEAAGSFGADIIITKLSANTPIDDFDEAVFRQSFENLINYLNPGKKARVIVASEFCKHPAEAVMKAYAHENNYPFCDLSDISAHQEYKAVGLFEHDGVAAHPGDVGMRVIAERICALI